MNIYFSVRMQEDWSLFNIGTHSSCKLRMKEEDSELSDDLAENTQVWLLVTEISTLHFVLLILIDLLVTHQQLSNGHCYQLFRVKLIH